MPNVSLVQVGKVIVGAALISVVLVSCCLRFWNTQVGRAHCETTLFSIAVEASREYVWTKPLRVGSAGRYGPSELNRWVPIEEFFPGSNWFRVLVRVEDTASVCVYSSRCEMVCCSHDSVGVVNEAGVCTPMPERPADHRHRASMDGIGAKAGLDGGY
jgi:hypothetical protein